MNRIALHRPAKKTNYRPARVAEVLLHEMIFLLQKEISDPHLKNISLTRASISPDLRQAKIFFNFGLEITKRNHPANPEPENADKKLRLAERHLKRAIGFFRRRLAEKLKLRVVPELHFYYDQELSDKERLVTLMGRISGE